MFSGMMLSQYTADMMIVEQRILSMPASIQSIPAAADQEDFVSMGMNTAIKNNQILEMPMGFLALNSWRQHRLLISGKRNTNSEQEFRRPRMSSENMSISLILTDRFTPIIPL